MSLPVYEKSGEDNFGDRYQIKVWDHGVVTLILSDTVLDISEAEHDYTPEAARKLAKRLKKAANLAESLR